MKNSLVKALAAGFLLMLSALTHAQESAPFQFSTLNDTIAPDVSFLNLSKESAFQLAFFNNTEKLKGIQIGFLNCAENGFFRCFPIFNIGK